MLSNIIAALAILTFVVLTCVVPHFLPDDDNGSDTDDYWYP